MKKFLFIVVITGCVLGIESGAWAISFIDVVDWDEKGPYGGVYYKRLETDSVPYTFTYTHSLELDPPGLVLNSAQLSLTHRNNSNICAGSEVWTTSSGGGKPIGQLSNSTADAWVTDTFTLNSDILNEIVSIIPWSLTVHLTEITTPGNILWIDKSELSGDYTPIGGTVIPEPSSVLLLGSGLLGLVGVRFRKHR